MFSSTENNLMHHDFTSIQLFIEMLSDKNSVKKKLVTFPGLQSVTQYSLKVLRSSVFDDDKVSDILEYSMLLK